MEVGEHCVKKWCFSDLRSLIFAFCTDHWPLDSLLASILKILTCFCYPHADFATNCTITKCIYMSEEPSILALLFVGSTTVFTHQKVNTCLCSPQYVTKMQIETLLINREESCFDVVQSSFMSPTNGKNVSSVLPYVVQMRHKVSFFLLLLVFTLEIWKKCQGEAGLDCLKSFKFSGVN